jgi:hypothetical protein
MAKNKILRVYQRMTEGALGGYALHIGTSMTGNPNFVTPAPPFTGAALTTLANTYISAVGAKVGSIGVLTAAKNAAQAALISALDQTADYVELNSQNNPVKIESAGFTLASTSHAQAQVGTTGINSVTNIATTKLALDLVVAANAWCYVIQVSTAPNVWTTWLVVTDPHDAVLTGLTPGTTYSIRACAMGSGNQQSEWCNTVTQMST